MNMNINSFLPLHLHSSVLCYTLVNTTESRPIIATCNSNGYMYEVNDKHIINCLNINQEKASSISSYNIFENNEFIIYYVIFATTNKLLLVKRQKNLKILKVLIDVKHFKVFDFKNLGFPQIKVFFIDSKESQIIEFSAHKLNSLKEQKIHSDLKENEQSFKSKKIIDTLFEKLQVVNMHIGDLREEYYDIKQTFCDKNCLENRKSNVVKVGLLQFLTTGANKVKPKVVIQSKWNKIYGNQFITVLKIHNDGNKVVSNLNIFFDHYAIKKFTSCFFAWPEKSSWPSKVKASIQPGEVLFVVGSFPISNFKFESKTLFTCYLNSSDFEDCLAKETLNMNPLDVFSTSNSFSKEGLTAEDLMAILTVKSEAKFTIRTAEGNVGLLEKLLLSPLNFQQMKCFQENFFYGESEFLKEIFVNLKELSVQPAAWKLILYTSGDEEVYLLVKALEDLLPENTIITLEEK